jgi:hypothetical protein
MLEVGAQRIVRGGYEAGRVDDERGTAAAGPPGRLRRRWRASAVLASSGDSGDL